MRELLSKRRQVFLEQCLSYSRYVLNDHFVLFLMVFLGFLALQYSQFLKHFPKEHGPVLLVVFLISLLLLPMGRMATYVEKADKQFLLVKEEMLIAELNRAAYRGFLFWTVIQTALLFLVVPVLLAMAWSPVLIALFLFSLAIGKFLIFQRRVQHFKVGNRLKWDDLIAYEEGRKQSVLRFFALFTNVKGISNSVKRRAYLDVVLGFFPKKHIHTWENLYIRSYLRNGDLFPLTMRLLGLALLSLVVIEQAWVATILAVLFNYLLVFQLLSLYHAYDYQYTRLLFPLDPVYKLKGLKKVIQMIGMTVLFLESFVALLFFKEKIFILLLLGVSLFFDTIYLSFKMRRLVD